MTEPFLGRNDATDGSVCPPDGRLPDAAHGADGIRKTFYRMGFTDKEIVALIGAHGEMPKILVMLSHSISSWTMP